MEGLVVSEAKLVVVVPPSMSKRIPEAVLQELSFHLFKYNEIFGGVLLAYDIRIDGKEAGVLQDILPHICVSLSGNLLVFNPKPDMLLEGTVVKLTPESIHVVVLGFASAVIVDEDIREELEYVDGRDGEVYQSKYHKHHVIKIGTVLRFQVKSLDEDIIHICGSLAPTGTGSVKWLEKRNMGTQMLDSTKGADGFIIGGMLSDL
ncbi:hypothetical protein MLD38_012870 [Melastoma candidum]|uniref:Uncharacterized protein n=1 Tax=Melastoma candidum TaxID=119954 RepID=A0ACB9R7P9_9MYRT|nr:hypothetical protein MLD38_012870 [Melastoma candidum]